MELKQLCEVKQFSVQGIFILSDQALHSFIELHSASLNVLEISKIPYPLDEEEVGVKATFWEAIDHCYSLEALIIQDPIGAH